MRGCVCTCVAGEQRWRQTWLARGAGPYQKSLSWRVFPAAQWVESWLGGTPTSVLSRAPVRASALLSRLWAGAPGPTSAPLVCSVPHMLADSSRSCIFRPCPAPPALRLPTLGHQAPSLFSGPYRAGGQHLSWAQPAPSTGGAEAALRAGGGACPCRNIRSWDRRCHHPAAQGGARPALSPAAWLPGPWVGGAFWKQPQEEAEICQGAYRGDHEGGQGMCAGGWIWEARNGAALQGGGWLSGSGQRDRAAQWEGQGREGASAAGGLGWGGNLRRGQPWPWGKWCC